MKLSSGEGRGTLLTRSACGMVCSLLCAVLFALLCQCVGASLWASHLGSDVETCDGWEGVSWSTTKDTSDRVDSGELPGDALSGLTARERGIWDSLTI